MQPKEEKKVPPPLESQPGKFSPLGTTDIPRRAQRPRGCPCRRPPFSLGRIAGAHFPHLPARSRATCALAFLRPRVPAGGQPILSPATCSGPRLSAPFLGKEGRLGASPGCGFPLTVRAEPGQPPGTLRCLQPSLPRASSRSNGPSPRAQPSKRNHRPAVPPRSRRDPRASCASGVASQGRELRIASSRFQPILAHFSREFVAG